MKRTSRKTRSSNVLTGGIRRRSLAEQRKESAVMSTKFSTNLSDAAKNRDLATNRGLIEISMDGLIAVDLAGAITYVNPSMCLMSGYSAEHLIGTCFAAYFSDPDHTVALVKEILEIGAVIDCARTLATQDGRHLNVSLRASAVRGKNDQVCGIFVSARDLTDEVRLQTQLRDERAYNRGLIEASLEGLVTVDLMLNITDVNDMMCCMVGYARSDLIGSPFPRYFTDQRRAADGVRLTLSHGTATNYELVLLGRTEDKTTVSFNASAFRGHDGRVQGIFASARDVSEQARLQSQLNEQKAYNRSLVEASADALFVIQPDGDIIDVNEATTRLTGHCRGDLIGTLFESYFTRPRQAREAIRRVLSEGKVTDYELTARAKNTTETVVSYNATTFYDREGKLQAVFGAARDVTDHKRFELALQEKNIELENADRSKDRFLASMSHELRTPLNAILGFTGTILMKLAGPLTTDQEKQLKTVQSSGRHLLSLINGLLDLARIESGKVELKLEPVSCGTLLEEVCATLRPLAEAKNLSFALQLPKKDVVLRTDRRSLSQIIINLSANAIKFTESGGVVLKLGQRRRKGRVATTIWVADTGIGIAPVLQTKLFQAFAQLDSSSTRRQDGSGLGLHLSQKLAQLIGGAINVKSELRKGSVFTVTILDKP
jgi:PAS domain S-box-containing protein